MSKLRVLLCALMTFLGPISTATYAQTYKVAIGDIPGVESLVKMIKTMGDDMKVKLEITMVPMQRMVSMIASKQADMGAPMLAVKDPDQIKNLPFDYSTESFQQMCFVIYTNKSKPIDIASLNSGNPKGFKIESDVSNTNMFKFTTLPSTNVEGSLKKVNDGLIDGYIMGQITADMVLKPLKLKNIKRQLYDIFNIVFALPKGSQGNAVDKFISEGLKKIRASGKYNKIMADAIKSGVYEEWQP